MPKGGKFDRCVQHVKKQGNVDNPYAVCMESVGSRDKGLVNTGEGWRDIAVGTKPKPITPTTEPNTVSRYYQQQDDKYKQGKPANSPVSILGNKTISKKGMFGNATRAVGSGIQKVYNTVTGGRDLEEVAPKRSNLVGSSRGSGGRGPVKKTQIVKTLVGEEKSVRPRANQTQTSRSWAINPYGGETTQAGFRSNERMSNKRERGTSKTRIKKDKSLLDHLVVKSLFNQSSNLMVLCDKMLGKVGNQQVKSLLVNKLVSLAKELDELETLQKSLNIIKWDGIEGNQCSDDVVGHFINVDGKRSNSNKKKKALPPNKPSTAGANMSRSAYQQASNLPRDVTTAGQMRTPNVSRIKPSDAKVGDIAKDILKQQGYTTRGYSRRD